MQPSIKNDLVYLLIVLESAGKIKSYTSKFTDAFEFFNAGDQLNFNASLLLLPNIGEQISMVSPQLKDKYPETGWRKIKDMRNRIVHDYTGVDYEACFFIVKNELPVLINNIQSIISEQISLGNFEPEEFEVARLSTFYRHVSFNEMI